MIENDHLGWCWVKRFWPPWGPCFFAGCGRKDPDKVKWKKTKVVLSLFPPNADIPNSLTKLRMQALNRNSWSQSWGTSPNSSPEKQHGKYPGNFIDAFGYAEGDVGLRGFAGRRSYDPKKWNCKASWSPTLWGGIERFWYGEDPLATWSFLVLKAWGCWRNQYSGCM